MRIQEGAFYHTRDGRKVGPMVKATFVDFDGYPLTTSQFWDKSRSITGLAWHANGSFIECCMSPLDLIRKAR